jgi:inosine/xanthosine triphosphate pyrophosphatase family protein
MADKLRVVYVTSNDFKAEENRVFVAKCHLVDGTPVHEVFEFEIRKVPILETLEVDLAVMVQAEVANAYSQIKVPCIVEHAGLIFEEYEAESFPGGLTKPMWNALGDEFIKETQSANRRAIARAVVAYCDGMGIRTFRGETRGTLAPSPRGARRFYWDTIFVPDDPRARSSGLTYAEIVEKFGLEYKVVEFSQSAKAMREFLEFFRKEGISKLWHSV